MGASSSFIYIFDLLRNRARVRVRLLEEQFDSRTPPGLKFEAENLGARVTSVEPIVRFHGFLPRPKGERPVDGFKLVPYGLLFKIDESAQRTLLVLLGQRVHATKSKVESLKDVAFPR